MDTWNDEKSLLLIDTYRNNPILWDPKDSNYFKKDLKERAWEAIGIELDENAAACKQKMTNILLTNRTEIAKRKKSSISGKDNTCDGKWYDALKFLRDRNTLQSKLDARNSSSEESEENNTNLVEKPPPPKKIKAEPNLLREAFELLKSVANKPDDQDVELQAFINFIYTKTKTYSKSTKNSVQHEIFQILMRADRGHYNYPESVSFKSYKTQSPATKISTTSTKTRSVLENDSDNSS